ncbi:MAG: heme-copper oxidase subunit III [Actinomycetota bacterium]|nr:heme-copper oxidase subunit III [Actinomycetota bacterium]
MTDIAAAHEDGAALHHDDHQTDGHHGGHRTSFGLSNMKLAFWLFLGSECLLFGALISTYLLSKARFITEVVAGNPNVVGTMPEGTLMAEFAESQSVEPMFDIPFTSLSSFVLLMSSLGMVLAHSAVSRGDHRNTRIWLTTTALLGSLFIGGQVYEFTAFYREGLTFTNNLFGSAFFTLTGFHGVHVTGGILMLVSLLFLSLRGKLNADRAETVELVGLYWHFVDVVWVLIFTIVYLIP